MMLTNDVRAQEPVRQQLAEQVAAFLQNGGRIRAAAITERQAEATGNLRERVAAGYRDPEAVKARREADRIEGWIQLGLDKKIICKRMGISLGRYDELTNRFAIGAKPPRSTPA